MSHIKDFELVSHGFVNENAFEEPACNPHTHILTGRGISELEAFNDVMEQIRTNEGILDLSALELEAKDLDDEYYDPPFQAVMDEDEEGFGYSDSDDDGDVWYFYSIKYTLLK